MRGFQLWINLPAKEKMKPAAYRDVPANQVTEMALAGGGRIRLIAGRVDIEGKNLAGPINPKAGDMSTDPLFLDLDLPAGAEIQVPVPNGHAAFLYVYEGGMEVSGDPLESRQAGILDAGDYVDLSAAANGVRAILVAGKPIGEPIVQYGPFVMNTPREIEQALADYRAGRLTA